MESPFATPSAISGQLALAAIWCQVPPEEALRSWQRRAAFTTMILPSTVPKRIRRLFSPIPDPASPKRQRVTDPPRAQSARSSETHLPEHLSGPSAGSRRLIAVPSSLDRDPPKAAGRTMIEAQATQTATRRIERVSVDRLQLDRENPRLVAGPGSATDEAIIARLHRAAELDELLHSISANGYLDIEPLIGLRAEESAFVVLEGNRRLVALRLLRDPDLVSRINSLDDLNITVPSVDATRRKTLDEVSVYPVDSREDARSFIGFKHINGPAKWDAYAKARFAADWYKSGRQHGLTLDQIAKAIGDRHDTIKRMVSAIYVLEQASAEMIFSIEDRYSKKFNFSHLYTALGRSQYMEYLGLDAKWAKYDPHPDPIPRGNLVPLRQVLLWIYGSRNDEIPPVVRSQNPHIKYLGEVIAHAQGRHVLEVTSDLDAAHEATEPVDRRFTASLIRAKHAISECAHSLRAYDGRDSSLLEIAEDVKETATLVWQGMKQKSENADSSE